MDVSARDRNNTKCKRYRARKPEINRINCKRWRRNNPDKMRDYHLKRRYGVSLPDYNRMLIEQNYCCGVCGKHQSELPIRLCVDHNHVTGQVRQLLCNHCNRAIGQFEDKSTLLRQAANYIDKWDGQSIRIGVVSLKWI